MKNQLIIIMFLLTSSLFAQPMGKMCLTQLSKKAHGQAARYDRDGRYIDGQDYAMGAVGIIRIFSEISNIKITGKATSLDVPTHSMGYKIYEARKSNYGLKNDAVIDDRYKYKYVYNLAVAPGMNHIEISKDGFKTIDLDIYCAIRTFIRYKLDLVREAWTEPLRGFPPNIFTEFSFKDKNSNGVLEARESAKIELKITNKGQGSAQRLQIKVQDPQPDPNIIIGTKWIREIESGSSIDVEIPLSAGIDVKTAEHRLEINVLEHFGYDMDPAYLLLYTQAYQPPELVFSGLEIIDSGEGTFARTEDGQLQAGEQVKVKIVVQNIGLREAKNTKYSITTIDDNIYIDGGSGSLGTLMPGDVKDLLITISPNKRVTSTDKLPIYMTLTESVGKGNLSNFQLPIKLNQKPPETNIVRVEAKPIHQQQIARFEYKSPKFTTRTSKIVDIRQVQRSKTRRPNSVAAVIGVEKYEHLIDAPYAADDAEVMKEYFTQRLGVDEVVLFKDSEVSGLFFDDVFNPDNGELQRAIIKGKTELFVYYSGHGVPNKDGSAVYLFPSDGKVHRLDKQGYDLQTLYANLNKLDTKHTTVILDACFSGASRSSSKIKTENLVAHKGVGIRIIKPWLMYPNFTVINSSSGVETSLGFDQSQTGLFTYYFALGLQGKADANGDLKVTLGELKTYVTDNVKEMSRKISGLQTPQFYGDEGRVLVEW